MTGVIGERDRTPGMRCPPQLIPPDSPTVVLAIKNVDFQERQVY